MAEKDWKDWADNDLVNEAQQGLRGQGAVVEMMRRLRDSNNRLAWVNVALATAILIVTIVQAWKY